MLQLLLAESIFLTPVSPIAALSPRCFMPFLACLRRTLSLWSSSKKKIIFPHFPIPLLSGVARGASFYQHLATCVRLGPMHGTHRRSFREVPSTLLARIYFHLRMWKVWVVEIATTPNIGTSEATGTAARVQILLLPVVRTRIFSSAPIRLTTLRFRCTT